MNKCETIAALCAWNMAIQHKLCIYDPTVSIEELAYTYGHAISTPENIDDASHLFNWDELMKLIEGTK